MAVRATPSRPIPGWVRVLRRVFWVGLWVLLAGILVQAALAGRGFFGASDFKPHVDLGWPLSHALAPLLLIVSFLCRLGWQDQTIAVAAVALLAVLPALPGMREDQPDVAALHPVLALVAFGLVLLLALRLRPMVMPVKRASAPA